MKRWVALAIALITGAALRLTNLERAPAGLDVDEAVNAWNAWCVAETGRDQHGVSWPIKETAGFGQGTTTLYMYVVAPFYRAFGFTTVWTRVPAALAGILTIALVYSIGAQLFDAGTGAVAALLLCVSPWHLQQSRWGHMSTMFPLAVAAVVASLLWAGFLCGTGSQTVRGRDSGRPAGGGRVENPSHIRAALAGGVTALFLYGYYAIRLWVPLFLVALALFTWPRWKSRATAVFVAAAAVVAAPLVIGTLRDPLLLKRAATTWVWSPQDSLFTRIGKVLARYPAHFGLDFLFRRGDQYPAMRPPPDYGVALWFTLPLMIVGAAWVVGHFRKIQARVLAALVITYPCADLLNEHDGPHGLRGIPGIIALTLLAAVGAMSLVRYFARASRAFAVAVAAIIAVIGAAEATTFTRAYFTELDRIPVRYIAFATDLVDACQWMKPRLDRYDAVFVTGNAISHPYVYTLVVLQYSPQRWLTDEKQFIEGPLPNGWFRYEQVCLRYGKLHFMFPGADDGELERMRSDGKPQRVLLVVRPNETFGLPVSPLMRMQDATGRETLWVIETTL
jgi:4-amino-4-deoxy-L-arabinose transferase-like glycosyltransferase